MPLSCPGFFHTVLAGAVSLGLSLSAFAAPLIPSPSVPRSTFVCTIPCLGVRDTFNVVDRDPRLNVNELDDVLGVMRNVNSMLRGLLVPWRTPVRVNQEEGRFVYSKGVVHVGHRYLKGGLSAPFARARIAIAHEWAHAVFDENMRHRSKEWRALSDWSRGGEVGPYPNEQVPRALFLLSRPYNEFFADLVAALAFKDRDAMRLALSHDSRETGGRIENDPKGLRGFSLALEPRGWVPPGRRFKTKIYYMLSPARSFIGQRYLSVRMLEENPSKLIKAALEVIASEFDWITTSLRTVKTTARASAPALSELMNRRLINSIERVLGGDSVDASAGTGASIRQPPMSIETSGMHLEKENEWEQWRSGTDQS